MAKIQKKTRLLWLQLSTQILNRIQCELKNGLTANLAASTVAAQEEKVPERKGETVINGFFCSLRG